MPTNHAVKSGHASPARFTWAGLDWDAALLALVGLGMGALFAAVIAGMI